MLFRLAYFSNNLLRRPRASAEGQLTKLLHAARHNNASLGVTGALLFDARYFAQVLEGERSHVSHLFCRICSDPRHDAVTIVEAKDIGERSFRSWSMALVRSDPQEIPFSPRSLNGDGLTSRLRDLLAMQMDAIGVEVEPHRSAPPAQKYNQRTK